MGSIQLAHFRRAGKQAGPPTDRQTELLPIQYNQVQVRRRHILKLHQIDKKKYRKWKSRLLSDQCAELNVKRQACPHRWEAKGTFPERGSDAVDTKELDIIFLNEIVFVCPAAERHSQLLLTTNFQTFNDTLTNVLFVFTPLTCCVASNYSEYYKYYTIYMRMCVCMHVCLSVCVAVIPRSINCYLFYWQTLTLIL